MFSKYIKYILGIILILIILIFIYPSEKSISNYRFYEYKNYDLNKSFSFVINTNDFKSMPPSININQVVYSELDTKVIFKSLNMKDGYVDISIYLDTNWHLKSGKCISITNLNQDGTSSSGRPPVKLISDDNKVIPYQNIGSYGLSEIDILIDKDEFYKYENITVLFTSVPVLEYKNKYLTIS